MRVVNFSEARSGVKPVIDQVVADADYTVITPRDAPDAPDAVLMSLDSFNSLLDLLDALLKARQEAGLTQAGLAARMGTQAPSVARLERRRALATGKHSPLVATLRKYVKACGKEFLLQVA